MKKMEVRPPKVLKTLLNEGKCDKQQEWQLNKAYLGCLGNHGNFSDFHFSLYYDMRITNMNLKW